MPEAILLYAHLLEHLAETLNLPAVSIRAVIGLVDEGSTVPFIARYRKEATGNLDEVQIRAIAENVEYLRELLQRRETVLASIAEQGKLTDELRTRVLAALDRSELEDIYLPLSLSAVPRPQSHARKGWNPSRNISGSKSQVGPA